MVQYTAGMLPKDEPVAFGRIVRQQAELHTRAPVLVSVRLSRQRVVRVARGRADGQVRRAVARDATASSFALTFDRAAERFLLSGWDVPGGDDWGPCWWIGGTPAAMAIPLDPKEG